VRNFRFVPQIFGGLILLIESKLTSLNGSCAQDAAGTGVADECRRLLCHVPLIGSCSHFCLILQPHRVAVPFPATFASPWRNSFVQIHGGTTLLKAKFGTTPQKRPKNDLNWGMGSSYVGTNKPPLPNPSFPYERAYAVSSYVNIMHTPDHPYLDVCTACMQQERHYTYIYICI